MSRSKFQSAAGGVLAFNLLVIVWGAYVRASGSGAGCGRHWPLCNGEVIPRTGNVKTLVELSHRVSSGVALIAVVALAVWAHRRFRPGDRIARAARWSVGFMLGEALIGAGLVLLELVAKNQSLRRAVAMPLHLTNTFLLLGSLTLMCLWGGGPSSVRARSSGHVSIFALIVPALSGLILVGITGAIAALGDTLFPAASLAAGIAEDFGASGGHFLLRIRFLHPFVAGAVAIWLLVMATTLPMRLPTVQVRLSARFLALLVGLQIVAGLANLFLLAPIGMQLVHLLLADLVWIATVVLSESALAEARYQGGSHVVNANAIASAPRAISPTGAKA